ncbi:uncharacterized protein [Penaeus vannamei]|uniref:uncharacterized protein n=1 Tax=Penaeus vannamei TaxID=6689 RepID=UPI00387F8991
MYYFGKLLFFPFFFPFLFSHLSSSLHFSLTSSLCSSFSSSSFSFSILLPFTLSLFFFQILPFSLLFFHNFLFLPLLLLFLLSCLSRFLPSSLSPLPSFPSSTSLLPPFFALSPLLLSFPFPHFLPPPLYPVQLYLPFLYVSSFSLHFFLFFCLSHFPFILFIKKKKIFPSFYSLPLFPFRSVHHFIVFILCISSFFPLPLFLLIFYLSFSSFLLSSFLPLFSTLLLSQSPSSLTFSFSLPFIFPSSFFFPTVLFHFISFSSLFPFLLHFPFPLTSFPPSLFPLSPFPPLLFFSLYPFFPFHNFPLPSSFSLLPSYYSHPHSHPPFHFPFHPPSHHPSTRRLIRASSSLRLDAVAWGSRERSRLSHRIAARERQRPQRQRQLGLDAVAQGSRERSRLSHRIAARERQRPQRQNHWEW